MMVASPWPWPWLFPCSSSPSSPAPLSSSSPSWLSRHNRESELGLERLCLFHGRSRLRLSALQANAAPDFHRRRRSVEEEDDGEDGDEDDDDGGGPLRGPSFEQCPIIRRRRRRRKRVFLLDVAPLCYKGRKPQPSAFVEWMRKFFANIVDKDPIVAVFDGERGNEFRKRLLSSYKSNRHTFVPLSSSIVRHTWKGDDADLREAFPCINDFFRECNVPVVKIEDAEADDVVASLTDQALLNGTRVVIASPDKDFKQLLCTNVQLVLPLQDLERWSFYTCEQYLAQMGCEPSIELSLRCILGDRCDGIPGLAEVSPGFGRNTALKLMKKHGSLENLLTEASIRTVGKPYIQNALTEHASFLLRNLQLLSLRRDLPVTLKEDWCLERDTSNDLPALEKLNERIKDLQLKRFRDRPIVRSLPSQQNHPRIQRWQKAHHNSQISSKI